jgi:spoIIIJ-associated protein
MSELEFTGRTTEEAIAKAVAHFGIPRKQIEIVVVRKGRAGLFGMGAEEALVAASILPQNPEDEEYSPKRPPAALKPAAASAPPPSREPRAEADGEPDPALQETAVGIVTDLLRMIGFNARVEVMPSQPDGALSLNIEGEDLGMLIGRRGQTIASFQFIVRVMISQKLRRWHSVSIDVTHYKQKRHEALQHLAVSMASQAKQSRRPVTLEPMPPDERRIVHLALANHPDVITHSIGEGDERKIVIQPKK